MTMTMKKANEIDSRIKFLKAKQKEDFILLKNQFEITYDSLKPINLIKDAFNEVKSNSDVRENIFSTSLGILGGYISKKIVFGRSKNPIKKISGALLQYVITNLITNKVESNKEK